MNITFFIALMFSLQLFYWIVGRRASREVSGKEDYFLAGKSVQLFPLMMTFLATQVGGGVVLGSAEEAFHHGWSVIFYPLGAALGLIWLGSGVGRKLAGFQVSTVAQIFEVVYGSKRLRTLASLFSVLSLFMILVAQLIASSKFLVSLGFDQPLLFIAFWAIVILYTAQGGLKAVISTDIVQALFFSAVFFLCFAFVLIFDASSSTLTMPAWDNVSQVSDKLWGWLLMPLLFMVIEQDMGQRCFAGASPRVVSQASLLAGLGTLAVCVVPVFFGTLAQSMALEVPAGGSVLMTAIAATTNPWITAIVGCAVLAAIISTATSLINAISSNLSGDFNLSLFRRFDPLRLGQGITAVISLAAILFAFYFDNIVELLIQSYELSVSCLFVPLFCALFMKHRVPSSLSAWMAIFCGIAGFIVFRFYPIVLPKEVASIMLSLLGYGLGELLAFAQSRAKSALSMSEN